MRKKYLTFFKRFLSVTFAIILGICSFACDMMCPHVDMDADGVCDICSVEITETQNKCATCGKTLNSNGKCATCDSQATKKCATCGGMLTNGKCAACDSQATKKCATCGGTLTNGKCATCDKEPAEPTTKVSLDGKKVLFTGNSLTYYGQTVLGSAGTDKLVTKKQNDKGFFSQFCKENGATVNVANWTFSGHVFSEVFGGECASCTKSQGKSINHLDYLDDRNYDYVVMQSGPTEGTNDKTFLSDVENIMNIFKAGNPNTKFVLLVPYTAYGVIGPGTPSVAKNTLNNLKTLANQGVTIVDLGGLVMDILNKTVTVPNSIITYEKNTFVVAQKASDGFHPNVLSGYITTVMTYCAITGDTAQGKAYDFCNDPALRNSSETSVYYNFDNFISKYYTVGTTNFDKVFASQTDMRGIQGLIDQHISAKAYMKYSY